MAIEWKATCGTASASIKCKRPNWESVKRAYEKINEIGKAEYNSVINNGGNSSQAELAQAQKRYEKVGGQALNEFNRDSKSYINTCAFRISYAFNYGGMPLEYNKVKLTGGTKLTGQDNYKYYTGVSSIKGLLLENWKRLKPYSQINNRDFYKVFYDHRVESYSTLSDLRIKEIRQDNREFLGIMQKLNKKGIVTMDIDAWSDAGGHTTLWNGSKFLDDTNYLNDERPLVFVRELCFWELL